MVQQSFMVFSVSFVNFVQKCQVLPVVSCGSCRRSLTRLASALCLLVSRRCPRPRCTGDCPHTTTATGRVPGPQCLHTPRHCHNHKHVTSQYATTLVTMTNTLCHYTPRHCRKYRYTQVFKYIIFNFTLRSTIAHTRTHFFYLTYQ